MKVTSREAAWAEVNKIFPTDYEKDDASSARAGYDIYRHPSLNYYNRICDLGCRLEVLTGECGENVTNIWIEEATAEEAAAAHQATEETPALTEERKEVARRLQRITFYYTEEYMEELANKEKEDAAMKAIEEAPDDGQIKFMVLTAENNAKVTLGCIKEMIRAVDILRNKEEDVDEWMLSGITAMLDKVREMRAIPYDLPNSICGLLGAQYRD